jgi:hypothetical protein
MMKQDRLPIHRSRKGAGNAGLRLGVFLSHRSGVPDPGR